MPVQISCDAHQWDGPCPPSAPGGESHPATNGASTWRTVLAAASSPLTPSRPRGRLLATRNCLVPSRNFRPATDLYFTRLLGHRKPVANPDSVGYLIRARPANGKVSSAISFSGWGVMTLHPGWVVRPPLIGDRV